MDEWMDGRDLITINGCLVVHVVELHILSRFCDPFHTGFLG